MFDSINHFEESDKSSMTRFNDKFINLNYEVSFSSYYNVYKHYSQSWTVRDGTTYGVHFVLYEKQSIINQHTHSIYMVYILEENNPITWRRIQALSRVSKNVHKTLLLVSISNEMILSSIVIN